MKEKTRAVDERRKYPRMGTFLEVLYSSVYHPAPTGKAYLGDLSRDGFKLLSRDPLCVGSHIRLAMSLPDDPAPMPAQGEVVWVAKEDGWHASGVKITHIEPQDRAKVLEHVCEEWLKKRRAQAS